MIIEALVYMFLVIGTILGALTAALLFTVLLICIAVKFTPSNERRPRR